MTALAPPFALPAFEDNYIWVLRHGDQAAVVDPGDAAPVLAYLQKHRLRLTAILNTHHHPDHVGGNAELLRHFPVPVYGPPDPRIAETTQPLREGDSFTLQAFGLEFQVLDIPGHTRSHIAFYAPGMLFCGDTLFACGCGRLFEGTPAQMQASLAKLAALPDDTGVYCGHEYTLANLRFARRLLPQDPVLLDWENTARTQRAADKPTLPSVLGQEKRGNPFLRCADAHIIAAVQHHTGMTQTDPVSIFSALREWKNNF
jgi:hydroxyacylglutathione hydrolase